MLWITIGIITSYIIGSIPTAYIFGRLIKGIDIRKFGSGNVGATNAMRVLGKKAGITVLLLDVCKGLVVVLFLGDFLAPKVTFMSSQALRMVLGFCSICGHNWTIFLNFKGGKGVATTIGVLLGLSIKIVGIKLIFVVLLTWFIIFLITRIVSIASVAAAVLLPVYLIFYKQSKMLIFFGVLLAIFIILRHISNLKRFFQGKEPRLKL